ncbi:RNA polymerase sigma factor [Olivibacter sitiensis]|uniref:RNA polymerase sigma factor n=1 Tax=Olivibacter sitiensis TaxID=376470 RepID=UPI0024813456|nr:sigma-70 family RNA polymerase sigma factor [Olivibacter sitiensis]
MCSGNLHAFDLLYNRYSLHIYRVLLKMVRDESIADELLQDVFVKIWDKRSKIDTNMPLGPFLYRVTERLVCDFYRKLSRESRLKKGLVETITLYDRNTEEDLQYKETLGNLNLAIEQLPLQQRLVFKLCKLEGKSYLEVSEELGISISTINGHIVKSTKSIKNFLFGKKQY